MNVGNYRRARRAGAARNRSPLFRSLGCHHLVDLRSQLLGVDVGRAAQHGGAGVILSGVGLRFGAPSSAVIGEPDFHMPSETETLALHLVRALYNATDGKPNQWRMLAGLYGATADAIEFAVARGWLLIARGHSVCLTDAGRRLVGDG